MWNFIIKHKKTLKKIIDHARKLIDSARMEIDDYQKQRPALGGGRGGQNKYTCAICRNGFDKVKVAYFGSFILELGVWLVAVVGGGLLLGALGASVGVVIGLVFSIIRLCSRKKVCPHCGAPNFIKNR